MNIGIDARLIRETGVGRYIRNLISQLARQDVKNHYVVFLRSDSFNTFQLPGPTWTKRRADVPWHSIREQIIMPVLFLRENLDLVHIPYFNVPILYPGRFIETLHDLTILHEHTGKATTLPMPLYILRRAGYRIVLWVGIHRASHVLTVSEATKQEILDHYGIADERITVTYEGVDDSVVARTGKRRSGVPKDSPYILYVGNAYPHKNLDTLLAALVLDKKLPHLILVGRHDYFYRRILTRASSLGLESRITFWGNATDTELRALYAGASALVFPSYMEGFGLPAIEALSHGCPVAVSDIPVFHEILGDSAVYFDPSDARALAAVTHMAIARKKSPGAVAKMLQATRRFRWDTLAQKTLSVYQRI